MDKYPKKPNKGIQRSHYPNQGFMQVQTPITYYPNSGYYISYPTVRQPIGNMSEEKTHCIILKILTGPKISTQHIKPVMLKL
ncbi:hypothetical protein GQ457_11G027920 [Hibiscus cannabinus]